METVCESIMIMYWIPRTEQLEARKIVDKRKKIIGRILIFK